MKTKQFILVFIFFSLQSGFCQNPYNELLPILDINSEARLGGIADIGVVSSLFYKDAGLLQNPSIISINSKYSGTGLYYRDLTDNQNNNKYLSGLTGYHAIDAVNSIGYNFSYLNYQDSIVPDSQSEFEPYEMFLQISYAHNFNNLFSGGLSIKYIRTNYGFSLIDKKINTYSVDLGFNYHKSYNLSEFSKLNSSAGLAIINFGPRIENTSNEKKFIPTKLLFGLFINPDLYLSEKVRLNIELAYQAEKYLTPSEPVYNDEGELIDGKIRILLFLLHFTSRFMIRQMVFQVN